MDIADYIIELLQQHEVAVVPGLGSFHTSRVEGYYSKDEQLFYPPSLQAQFTKEEQEGTDLVNLIAERRQISLASARYFIEKFVSSLKEQVVAESVKLGNMGVFTTRRGELIFEANSLNESYEQYYGLAPVKLKRASAFRQDAQENDAPKRSPFFETPRVVEKQAHVMPEEPAELLPPVELPPPPVAAEPVYTIPPTPEPFVTPHAEPHIVTPPVHTVFVPEENAPVEVEEEVEYEEKRGMSVWLILAIIIVGLGIALIGLYKYKPDLFVSILPPPPKPSVAKPIDRKSATDSMSKALQAQHDSASATKPDSATVHATKVISAPTKPITAQLDTFGVVLATLKTAKSAETEAKRYLKKYPETIVLKNPDNLYCVNIKIYNNPDSANAERLKIITERHLTVSDVRVQKYPNKKP